MRDIARCSYPFDLRTFAHLCSLAQNYILREHSIIVDVK